MQNQTAPNLPSTQLGKALLCLMTSALLFSIMGVCIRFASQTVDNATVVFFRNAVGLFIFITMLFKQGLDFIKTDIEEQQEESFVLNYMRWIYHSEFVLDYECISPFNLKYEDTMHLNHWLEQWYLTYRNVLELPIKQKPFYFIHYESLCNDSTVWIEVKKLLDLNKELTFPFKESQKNIEETYDHELLFQSNDLYKELQQRSFPIS